MLKKLSKIKIGQFTAAIVFAIIGLCFLLLQKTPSLLAVSVGITLALFGFLFLSRCILSLKKNFSFAVKVAFAVISLACGVLTAIFGEASLVIVFSAISLILIVNSSFKLQFSFKLRFSAVDGWWALTAISALVILSSFLFLKIAPKSISASAIWLGITLLLDSVGNFISAIWAPKCKATEKAEIYYEVFNDVENFNKQ